MATLRLGSKVICPVKIKAPTTEVLSVVPSTSQQIITPLTNPYSKILVSDITASIDNNITGSNIKKGIQILGVTGTYELPKPSIRIDKILTAEGMLTTGESFINLIGATNIPEYGLYEAYIYANLTGNIDLSKITAVGTGGLYRTFRQTNITSLDLSGLVTVDASTALYETCYQATSLTNLNLSNLEVISGSQGLYGIAIGTGIEEIDLSKLVMISGASGLCTAFKNCTGLTKVCFDSLSIITGQYAMKQAFENCTNLTNLIFPALTASSFDTRTDQFDDMLSGVTSCVVHFPSDLESVIGNWTSVLNGFGGTNTVVLFDLPACVRDSSADLVWNFEEGRYEPATNA